MGYIRFQNLFLFTLMMFIIPGMEDKDDMDNNLETNIINEQVVGNDLLEERRIEQPNYVFDFQQFNKNIHRIINQYLEVKEQGLYSILNKNMAQILNFYLSMRVKALLYRPPREQSRLDLGSKSLHGHLVPMGARELKKKSSKIPLKKEPKTLTELSGDQVLSFEKSFHFLMKYMDDINHFYSIKNVPKMMEYADMPPLPYCEFCDGSGKTILNTEGRSLCNACYEFDLQSDQTLGPKRKRKTEKQEILWGEKRYTYDRSFGIFYWQPSLNSCEDNISRALPTFPLAVKYTLNGKPHLELLRHYHIESLQMADQDINLIELKLQVSVPQSLLAKRVFSCHFKTNIDARTNVKSVKWHMEKQHAACTVIDNQLVNTKKHKIDALFLVDSKGTFQIIRAVSETNSNE